MKNIFKQNFLVKREHRNKLHNHNSFLLWLTGLSGSGKSTLANKVEQKLHEMKISTFILDGDNIRHGLNNDLDFSANSRKENIRRIAEVSNLFINSGIVTISAFVSPYIKDRENVKKIVGSRNFFEIYIKSSVEECEKRDVKGLYKKARSGEINNLTGISSPYEIPKEPDLEINTEILSISESTSKLLDFIKMKL